MGKVKSASASASAANLHNRYLENTDQEEDCTSDLTIECFGSYVNGQDQESSGHREPDLIVESSMAFTLWALLEAGLLVVNAICVLHERRFLAKGEGCRSRFPVSPII